MPRSISHFAERASDCEGPEISSFALAVPDSRPILYIFRGKRGHEQRVPLLSPLNELARRRPSEVLPGIIAASAADLVVVCEGDKDAGGRRELYCETRISVSEAQSGSSN